LAAGAHQIRHLAERAIASAEAEADAEVPDPPPIGDVAPVFTLPGLDGSEVPLVDSRGRLTVLLYWSPTCVFCRELREDLRAWESTTGPGRGPRLVVISTGSLKANRAEGFLGPVALDDGQLTRRAYGFSGTPQAILIDANGQVASGLARGAEQVLALLARASVLAEAADRVAEVASRRRLAVTADAPSDGR
jgi:hypothetical protein